MIKIATILLFCRSPAKGKPLSKKKTGTVAIQGPSFIIKALGSGPSRRFWQSCPSSVALDIITPGNTRRLRRQRSFSWSPGIAPESVTTAWFQCRSCDHEVARRDTNVMGKFTVTGWVKTLDWMSTGPFAVLHLAVVFALMNCAGL
jgi:hypothetical protein